MATPIKAPGRWQGPMFVLTILTGSFLLFLVQPMVARMALPRLGGAPAVWNSAMLVYQALLLGGYAYAHAIGRLAPRRQAMVHLALFAVAALWLPLGLVAGNPPPDAAPVLWVPWLLALSIGPLFFAVAAQAPLMQRWYSLASGGRDPYALYAASNLGSFGGLIAYPLLVEPNMPIAAQSALWTGGYALLALLILACATLLPRGSASDSVAAPVQTSPRPALRRRLHWIALAAVPSGLMLSTTTHLTTDIVAMPLLWVIPLGLYLLSFSLAFAARRGAADAITWLAPPALLGLGAVALAGGDRLLLSAGAGLTLLFVVSVALHTRTYRLRPAPDRLTEFYLAMSIGGVVGGLFAALLAPVLFDWTFEHPILILAAGMLAPQAVLSERIAALWAHRGMRIAILLFALLLLAVFAGWLPFPASYRPHAATLGLVVIGMLAIGRRGSFVAVLAGILLINGVMGQIAISLQGDMRTRSYFGIYTIADYPVEHLRTISHGTTVHGIQSLVPGRETEPTSYYVAKSGVGRALSALEAIHGTGARVGIVGLGAGTLACYARPGQAWRFYEIDPAVVRIARDSGKFSFLSRCTPKVPIEIGDARLTLAAAPPASLDFLALDAFSSDSVPMHLLTREAFAGYRRVLTDRGLLLVHISNRYLDLEPVIAAAARAGGWHGAALLYAANWDPKPMPQGTSSLWIALSPDAATLAQVTAAGEKDPSGAWRPLKGKNGFTPWTDDFSSILPLVKAWAPARETH